MGTPLAAGRVAEAIAAAQLEQWTVLGNAYGLLAGARHPIAEHAAASVYYWRNKRRTHRRAAIQPAVMGGTVPPAPSYLELDRLRPRAWRPA